MKHYVVVSTLLLQSERHYAHRVLHVQLLHIRSQTNQYQFLKPDNSAMATYPVCDVITASATSPSTAALIDDILLTAPSKVIHIRISEILRNLLDVNTVPDVVRDIWIATTSYSPPWPPLLWPPPTSHLLI